MPFGTASVLTNVGKAILANLAIGSGTVPKWLAVGTGAQTADRTAVAGDTALSTAAGSRVGTNNPTRTTTTVTNDTWSLTQEYTATTLTAINEVGIFDASTGGNMFISATFPVINLLDTNKLEITATVQFQ